MQNGRSKDAVSCSGLLAEIHTETEAIPPVELPIVRGAVAAQLAVRNMSKWLEKQPWARKADPFEPQIGDIILYQDKNSEFHMGGWIGLRDGQPDSFIHSIRPFGVSYSNLADVTYKSRLSRVWRIYAKP